MADKNIKITFEVDGVQQTVNSVEELNDALEGTGKAAKEAGDQQGFFSKRTAEFKEQMAGLKATLGEVRTGFKNGVKGLGNFVKGFKTAGGAAKNFGTIAKGAIAATGIGLLIVAVTSLINYFSNLEGGAKALKKVMAGLGAIVTNISKAFSLVVQGKFSEAFDTLKNSVTEATAAVDSQFEAESRLSELRQKNIIENAKLTQEIEKQKKVLEDGTKSTEERLAALDKVNEATRKLQQNQIDETKLALQQAQAELVNINNYEERRQKQEEISQLQADLIDQGTQLQNIEYDAARVGREIRAAEKAEKEAAAAEEKARLEKAAADKKAISDKEAADQEKKRQEKMAADKKASEEAVALAKKEADEKQKLEEAVAASKKQITNDVLSTITQIAGEQSVVGKAAAVSQATINTYQAATNALANTPAPPPFPQIAAGVTIAQGLMQVRNILKTPTPGDAGGGGSTPSIAAPSAPSFNPGNTNAEAQFAQQNAGETLTLSQRGSQATIKAYVVAEDMTSTQEANKRIDDLSRL